MNWVSVKDELPEYAEEVLVYIPIPAKGINIVCYYYPNEARKFSCYDHFQCEILPEVTHWMRLTKPE